MEIMGSEGGEEGSEQAGGCVPGFEGQVWALFEEAQEAAYLVATLFSVGASEGDREDGSGMQ